MRGGRNNVNGLPRRTLLVLVLATENIALLAAILLSRWLDVNLHLLRGHIFRDMLIGTLSALPPLGLFAFSMSDKVKNITFLRRLRATMMDRVRPVFAGAKLPDLILIALAAGIAEELLFRGVIQTRFGLIAASVLFGAVHYVTPAYVVITALIGLYIGALYAFFGSLIVPIQLHFIYDLAALIYLKYFVVDKE
jgi:membrane protease YdiL (CAAX protease family)